MKPETYLTRLIEAAVDHTTPAKQISDAMILVFERMADGHPNGQEALAMFRNRVMKQTLAEAFGERNAAPAASNTNNKKPNGYTNFTNGHTTTAKKPTRVMSEATKAKLSASSKARWDKIKKANAAGAKKQAAAAKARARAEEGSQSNA